MTDRGCFECGDETSVVMIKDELWQRVSRGDRLLCLSCIEWRLGRELTLFDLKECGFTRTIRTFVMRERRKKHD